MARIFLTLVAVAALVIWAMPWDGGPFAWMPSENEVQREFSKRYPQYKVLKVVKGGIDNDGTSYSISFQDSSRSEPTVVIWSIYSSGNFYGWTLLGERIQQ